MAGNSRIELSDMEIDQSLQALLQDDLATEDPTRLRRENAYFGFDNSVGHTWIYPVKYPKRTYQYSIVKQALFKNTMVVLPTGLGKTFIAAVVMYNIYRWYPKGKVIFMAPARPLVAQQVNACYDIMGIPKEDTVEVTGRQTKKSRHENWKTKRVFYATPQAVQSDILNPEHNFPIKDIKLVVIDEAHKARGRYAYCEVIKMISEENKAFRVLALTATPGRHIADVKEVVENLLISHIEIRYENSIDVAPYTFKKKIKTETVNFDDTIKRIREQLIDILTPYLNILSNSNLVNSNPNSNSKGRLIIAQKDFRHLATIEKPRNYSEICSAFSTCISLYHSLEILERHGVRMFLNSMLDSESKNGFKYFVAANAKLMQLIESIKEEIGCADISLNNSTLNKNDENFFFGHPKYEVLEQKLLEHFGASDKAKAMIFCEFRETVCLIDILLAKHKPLIRVKKLVGQGSSSSVKAVTQKEQIAVMKEFKAGRCNCLIATCVAEEGIDVGDVDLIVCFDSTSNPTRYIQRIGRTGRKQQGNVLMLVSEGKESETFKHVVSKKDKTNQNITKSREIEWALYKQSPRMVPPQFEPNCLEVFCNFPKDNNPDELQGSEQPSTEHQPSTSKKTEPKKKPTKATTSNKKKDDTPPAGVKDMRHFFKPLTTQSNNIPKPTQINETNTNDVSLVDHSNIVTQYDTGFAQPYQDVEPVVAYLDDRRSERKTTLKSESGFTDISGKENKSLDEEWVFLNQIRMQLNKRATLGIAKTPFTESPFTDLTNSNLSQDLKRKLKIWTEMCSHLDSKENSERWKQLVKGPEISFVASLDLDRNNKPTIFSQSPFDLTGISFQHPIESRYANVVSKVGEDQCRELVDIDISKIETSLINLEKSIRTMMPSELLCESTPIRVHAVETSKPSTEKEVLSALGLESIDDLFPCSDDEMVTDFDESKVKESEFEVAEINADYNSYSDEKMMEFEVVKNEHFEITEEVVINQPGTESKNENRQTSDTLTGLIDFDKLFDDDEELLKISENATNINVSEQVAKEHDDLKLHEATCRASSTASVEEVKNSQENLPKRLTGRRRAISQIKQTSALPISKPVAQYFSCGSTHEKLVPIEEEIDTSVVNQMISTSFAPAQMSTPNIPKTLSRMTIQNLNETVSPNNEKPPPVRTSPSLLELIEPPNNHFLLQIKDQEKPVSPAHRAVGEKEQIALLSPITPANRKMLLARCHTSPCLVISSEKNTSFSAMMLKDEGKNEVSPNFATQVRPKGMMGLRKRRIMSDSEEENESPQAKIPKKKPRHRAGKNSFLDMEANVSKDDSEDDKDNSEDCSQTLGGFVVYNTDARDETHMFAKYVESTKSPVSSRGGFKMPDRLREFRREEIFSQAVPETSSQYEVDGSFVVDNEEDVTSSDSELCPLEMAEMILEAERKSRKRKRK